MKSPLPSLLLAGTVLALFAGCSSPQTASSSTEARQALFSRLTPREQAMIKQHQIAVGFTTDMVLLSLDKPDRVVAGPGPEQETWLYQSYYAADGSSLASGQRIATHTRGSGPQMPKSNPTTPAATRHPETNTYTVEYDPTLFQEKTEANARVSVIFLRGLVADIRVDSI